MTGRFRARAIFATVIAYRMKYNPKITLNKKPTFTTSLSDTRRKLYKTSLKSIGHVFSVTARRVSLPQTAAPNETGRGDVQQKSYSTSAQPAA